MADGEATLRERFVDIGLDDKEAGVIILLATSEPLKASEVGAKVGISRMDSYNTLKRLQERGLVKATLDKPMRFAGLSVSDVFQQLINHEEQELRRIQTHLEEFTKGQSRPYTRHQEVGEEPSFSVVKERSYIHAATNRIIEDAENEVWMLLGEYGILHIVKTRVVDTLNEAAVRGVRIKVLATMKQATMKYYEMLDEAIEIRHSDSVSMHGCIVDGDVAVQNVFIESNPVGRGRADTALVIEAASYLSAQLDLVETAWKNSTPFSVAKSHIERGESAEPLHINLGAGSFYRRFKEYIASDLSDQHPDGEGWTNAILREGEKIVTPQPSLPQLEFLGLDISDLMRMVGRRIGAEHSLEISSIVDSDAEFWVALSEEWKLMGMGSMEFDGEPPSSIRVNDAGSCGGAPDFGKPFCNLDEGIIEGIIESRLHTTSATVERVCSGEGGGNCHYVILLGQLET